MVALHFDEQVARAHFLARPHEGHGAHARLVVQQQGDAFQAGALDDGAVRQRGQESS
jgi:hypothetical protein